MYLLFGGSTSSANRVPTTIPLNYFQHANLQNKLEKVLFKAKRHAKSATKPTIRLNNRQSTKLLGNMKKRIQTNSDNSMKESKTKK